MKIKHNLNKWVGLIGLSSIVGSLIPTQMVYATPERPTSLEEFWREAGLEEVEEVVTRPMLEQQERLLLELSNNISMNEIKREALKDSIEDKEAGIAETKAEIAEKEELYTRRKEKAQGQLVSLQLNKTDTMMTMVNAVLKAESLPEAIGRLRVVAKLTGANSTLMEQLEVEQTELNRLERKLSREMELLINEKTTMDKLIAEMKDQKETVLAVQEEMEEQWAIQEEEKAKLKAEQERLQQEYQDILDEQFALLSSILDENIQTYEEGNKALEALAGRKTDPILSNQVVKDAVGFLGVPYVWGGSTRKGFDCSGLTQFVYRDAGITLPRTASQQSKEGTRIEFKDMEPGDLVFWGKEGASYHVGIFIGNGRFLHAPKPGDVVKITKMKHFKPDFAKRVLPENSLNLTQRLDDDALMSLSSSKSTATDDREKAMAVDSTDLIEGIFNVTYYSAYDGTQIGITAGGTSMANGNIHTRDGYRIVAVDPTVIPMGTIMRITTGLGETFLGKADDTGGVIKGNKIDIGVSSPEEAFRLGRTTAVIEIVK